MRSPRQLCESLALVVALLYAPNKAGTYVVADNIKGLAYF
jgi:hypothetical protein